MNKNPSGPASNACASYHTYFFLLTWQIFAVQLDFTQRILTQNRFTTKSCENCILGMKQRHTIGQGNRYVTTFTMCFYFPRMTPNQRSHSCVFDPIIRLSNQFAILWIKSSRTDEICKVNKSKLVWYDAQALDAGIR